MPTTPFVSGVERYSNVGAMVGSTTALFGDQAPKLEGTGGATGMVQKS